MTDENRSDDTARAIRTLRNEDVQTDAVEGAVERALQDRAPAIYNTHSIALAGEMNAKAEGIKLMVADMDAKIAALQAERTDLMLSYSMLSHGMQARENGSR